MKKNFRSLIASVLAVMMIFSLAACGKTDSSGGGSGTPSGGKPGGKTADTPAFVYVSSFREIPSEDNQSVGALCFTDEGFYTSTSDVVGRREPKEGEKEQWEGQFDILEDRLWFVSFDGKRTKLDNYEPFKLSVADGHDGSVELYRLAADATGDLAATAGEEKALSVIEEVKKLLEKTRKLDDSEVIQKIKSLAEERGIDITEDQSDRIFEFCRSFEKLSIEDVKERVKGTAEKVKTFWEKVKAFFRKVRDIVKAIVDFIRSVVDFFSRLFGACSGSGAVIRAR